MPDDRTLGAPADPGSGASGAARVLVALYAVFALAAGSRAAVQLATRFDEAPLAYLLSALAGVVYILATVGLASTRPWARPLAWGAVVFELTGVLVVGTLTVFDRGDFPDDTMTASGDHVEFERLLGVQATRVVVISPEHGLEEFLDL